MNNLWKICLAVSCFMPLYMILGIKNILKITEMVNAGTFSLKSFDFLFNTAVLAIWAISFLSGSIAIISFKKKFLCSCEKPRERIVIENAENITSDYYFAYFSMFVLTFLTFDPTSWFDVSVLFLIMLSMILVYVKNEMWFINPMLNIIGCKSFRVVYSKADVKNKQYEIKAFSHDHLNKKTGEDYYVSYSPYDFSVCYSKN